MVEDGSIINFPVIRNIRIPRNGLKEIQMTCGPKYQQANTSWKAIWQNVLKLKNRNKKLVLLKTGSSVPGKVRYRHA